MLSFSVKTCALRKRTKRIEPTMMSAASEAITIAPFLWRLISVMMGSALDVGDYVALCRALKRQTTSHHFVEHAAQAPDVRAPIHSQPSCLLRRHVRCCTHDHAWICIDHRACDCFGVVERLLLRFLIRFSQPEVQDFNDRII